MLFRSGEAHDPFQLANPRPHMRNQFLLHADAMTTAARPRKLTFINFATGCYFAPMAMIGAPAEMLVSLVWSAISSSSSDRVYNDRSLSAASSCRRR